jgi:diguanylate cyclase (GGDEF)-like protein
MFVVMAGLLASTAVLRGLWLEAPVASFGDLLGNVLPLVNSIGILCICFVVMLIAHDLARHRFRRLASVDDLTGLPNRRFFLEEGARLSRQANLFPGCVLMMDLDRFNDVNRRFGHAGGDRALGAFAEILRQGLRPSDLVARFGGEEFCALLPNTRLSEAIAVAQRLRQAVARLSIDRDGQAMRITVSIGVAPLRQGELAESVRDADEALYRAKGLGRNRVVASPADAAAEQPPGT